MKLPVRLASGHVLAGLTAPSMRVALVLIGHASATGSFDILKPTLEADANLRIDNAHRFMERLRECVLAFDTEGVPVFDHIDCTPGVQKRLAGIVKGSLSQDFFAVTAMGRTVSVPVDELGKLSTVPGILLWLRLALEREKRIGEFRLRLTEAEAAAIFGAYVGRAAIKRTTQRDGAFHWTSLSRIYAQLIKPAVNDVWNAIEGYTIDARPGVPERGRGRAWSYIDISLTRLRPTPGLRELNERQRRRTEYEARKHIPEDPADR